MPANFQIWQLVASIQSRGPEKELTLYVNVNVNIHFILDERMA